LPSNARSLTTVLQDVYLFFTISLVVCLGNKESNFYQLLLYQGKQQPVALANITPGKQDRLKALQHVIADPWEHILHHLKYT
jgi:hypothetical protein